MNTIDKVNQTKLFPPLISGLIYAFIVMLAGTLVTSFYLLFSNSGENSLPTFSYLTHIVSLLVGGFIAGRKSRAKGWYYGGLLGLIYCLIIFMIAFLAYDAGLSMRSVALLGTCLATSAIGGIFGVNSKNK